MSQIPTVPRAMVALVSVAAFVIVVTGMKDAQDIALPVVFSLFLAILAWPVVRLLVRVHVPKALSILVVMLLIAGALVGSTAIVGDSLASFGSSIPKYQAPLEAQIDRINQLLEARGLSRLAEVESFFDPASILQAVRSIGAAILSIASNLLIVLVTTAILLLEATEIGTKLRVAFRDRGGAGWIEVAADNVQRYLALKTIFSLATGLLLGIWTAVWGLDFPVLWGLIAFVLNFVPAIGSIVAAVAPVTLALVLYSPGHAVAVAAGYLAVNVAIGNFVEPRIMGRRLGLSPFVVILSLFFWGYVWGPGGMLVGVPLTVIAKLMLETSPQTRWIAVLLGDADDALSVPPAVTDAAGDAADPSTPQLADAPRVAGDPEDDRAA